MAGMRNVVAKLLSRRRYMSIHMRVETRGAQRKKEEDMCREAASGKPLARFYDEKSRRVVCKRQRQQQSDK